MNNCFYLHFGLIILYVKLKLLNCSTWTTPYDMERRIITKHWKMIDNVKSTPNIKCRLTMKFCNDLHVKGMECPIEFVNILKQCRPKSTIVRKLRETCWSNDDCGINASCLNGKCQCQLGFIPKGGFLDSQDCQLMSCKGDTQCSSLFNHTTCYYSHCRCALDHGFVYNRTLERCTLRSKKIGNNCSDKSECGSSTICLLGKCQCLFGTAPQTNMMDCLKEQCSDDSQCALLSTNSKCSKNKSSCVCSSNYNLNSLTNVCVPDTDTGIELLDSTYLFAIVGFILLITGVVVIGVKLGRRFSCLLSFNTNFETNNNK